VNVWFFYRAFLKSLNKALLKQILNVRPFTAR
jgi:hypothetical protein